MKNSLKKVSDFIEQNKMILPGEKVAVAFSGGFDSVCLALMLKELGFEILLAHVNHNLRETAKRDENFCREFASKYGIPLFVSSPDVSGYAKEHKISTETAGRLLRYEFFSSLNADKIATAHHKNDSAETVLWHLVRGSGLKGLTGILPVRDSIIRPLLCLTRAEIEEYVTERNVTPCTDETNFSEDYTRNRIRLSVIPLLEKENEKAVENICKTASLLQADEEFILSVAEKYIVNDSVEISKLKTAPFPVASRILRLLYTNAAGTSKDFELRHTEYILSHLKEHGEILNLPFGVTASAEYGMLKFKKALDGNTFCVPLNLNGKTSAPGVCITCTPAEKGEKSKKYFFIDIDKAKESEIVLRTPKKGDKFTPLNSEGGKSLAKVFIDMKIPRDSRPFVPVIACGSEILSIVGKKHGNLFACDKNTKAFLKIEEEFI